MDERLHELLAINRAIASSLDYEEVLALVVDKTVALTGADGCALLLPDGSGDARVAASQGIDEPRARAFVAPFDERINVALRELLAYDVDDTFLGVPVIHQQTVAGMLVVYRRAPKGSPDPEEQVLLAALADQAAIALDHASRYRALWHESLQARRELELTAVRKDQYLAMLAHELRNPLAAIVSAMSVFEIRPQGDPMLVRAQQAATRQALHMKRLLDDLLDVSRVTNGKISLEKRPVDVQGLVAQAVQSVQPLIRQRGHALVVELPDEPVFVDGDRDRLVQVLSNLLDNAAKYSAPGGHIQVTVVPGAHDVELRVRDRGRGIATDQLPTVFDLFVQLERGTHRREGGLGIGLTVVRELVQLHGGEVEARSEGVGHGCELVVRLPQAVVRGVEQPPPSAKGPRALGCRVLLVEDDRDVATTMGALLQSHGHEVTVAPDGETALEQLAAAQELPEVMVVDIGLPGIDGYEVAQRVRARDDQVRLVLVAVTGYGQEQDRERSRQAGFDHHLVKPVAMEQLGRVLASAGSGAGRTLDRRRPG